jgi:hypothetical protein
MLLVLLVEQEELELLQASQEVPCPTLEAAVVVLLQHPILAAQGVPAAAGLVLMVEVHQRLERLELQTQVAVVVVVDIMVAHQLMMF